MEKQIKVNREWLKRLVELGNLAELERQNKTQWPQWIPHLIGYIQGSKSILDKENE